MRLIIKLVFCLALATLASCADIQIHTSSKHHVIALQPGDLKRHGLAFLTPTTPTGHEEDKQALAFGFSDMLSKQRKDINLLSLPEVLSHVNQANLSNDYRRMYDEYRVTGILNKTILNKISHVSETRYLALLNLGKFDQGSNSRFGLLGWRLIDTKYSSMRLFLQIWDGHEGTVAWEGLVELNYSDESFSEQPISFRQVVEESAKLLIDKLP